MTNDTNINGKRITNIISITVAKFLFLFRRLEFINGRIISHSMDDIVVLELFVSTRETTTNSASSKREKITKHRQVNIHTSVNRNNIK